MASSKTTSKVEHYNINVPAPKENNFFDKVGSLLFQLKYVIHIQFWLGINRLYLLKSGVFISRISYLYAFFLVFFTIYIMSISDFSDGTFFVFKETICTEYIILIISAFTYKRTLESFFRDLANFDDTLNISNDIISATKIYRAIFWMIGSIAYGLIEYALFYFLIGFVDFYPSIIFINITLWAHDSEQIFFVTLIRTIMLRVFVLKAHIKKTFGSDRDETNTEENEKIAEMSKKVQLDTTAMHRAYELLHKCADQLNSCMSLPMIVMLFTSGLSTTVLLKKFFQIVQNQGQKDMVYMGVNGMLVYTSVRCIKYTILVIIPCYYASVTSRQVATIRTTLHHAVNTLKIDKLERRKIKAFFHLTQDNQFTYALWGVIRLSMSLPLSYASLCTTYLVIAIQFSKFID